MVPPVLAGWAPAGSAAGTAATTNNATAETSDQKPVLTRVPPFSTCVLHLSGAQRSTKLSFVARKGDVRDRRRAVPGVIW